MSLDSFQAISDGAGTVIDTIQTEVESFAAMFLTEFVQPNRFRVDIGVPKVLEGAVTDNEMSQLNRSCFQASMPNLSIGTFDHRKGGPITKLPNDIIFNPVSFSFRSTGSQDEHKLMTKWCNSIYDINTGTFEFYENYVTSIFVHQMNKRQQVIRTVELIEAYPAIVGEVALGYDQFDSVQFFPTTFNFRKWK